MRKYQAVLLLDGYALEIDQLGVPCQPEVVTKMSEQ
jgi:hypothetical protein